MLEQRAQRTICKTRRENRLGGWASLAAEERARNFSARIKPLFVFHREREKVNAFAHTAHGGRRKDDGIVDANSHCTASLSGQLACLKGNGARTDNGRVALGFRFHVVAYGGREKISIPL